MSYKKLQKVQNAAGRIMLRMPRIENTTESCHASVNWTLSFNQQIMNTCQSAYQQIMNTCQSAFCELRQISSVHKYLIIDATKRIVCSLVLSRLDYCNGILSGSSKCLIKNCRRFKMQLRD